MTPAARVKALQSAIARIERIDLGGYCSLELRAALSDLYQLLEDARAMEDEALTKQDERSGAC